MCGKHVRRSYFTLCVLYITTIEKRFREARERVELIFKHITDARRIPMNLSCLLNKRKYPKAIIARSRFADGTIHNTTTV